MHFVVHHKVLVFLYHPSHSQHHPMYTLTKTYHSIPITPSLTHPSSRTDRHAVLQSSLQGGEFPVRLILEEGRLDNQTHMVSPEFMTLADIMQVCVYLVRMIWVLI